MSVDHQQYAYLIHEADLTALVDWIDEEEFTNAMNKAMKCLVDPYVPKEKVGALVVVFSAYGMKFKMQAKLYETIKRDKAGTPNNYKKDIYYSMSEQCHKMADALKYLVKT